MKKNNNLVILGIAVGLPSNILGAFYISHLLEQNNYVSSNVAMFIVLGVIAINLIWMVRYALKKND